MRRRLVEVGILLIMTAFLLGGCMLFGDKSISPLQAKSLRHIEVVVTGRLTDSIVADLEIYGTITKRLDKIGGVAMDVRESGLAGLSSLLYVKVLGDRAERHALDYSSGIST